MTLGFGTPKDNFTASDGSSSGVLYMTFKGFGAAELQIWLIKADSSGTSYLWAKWESGRNMYLWGGKKGDVQHLEVFLTEQCITKSGDIGANM